MAFPDDVTLNNGTADKIYSIISMAGGKSIRKDAAQELSAPKTLTISHQTNGTGTAAIARRMIRLDETFPDSDGEAETVSIHTVITVKTAGSATKERVQELMNEHSGFLVGVGNLAKVLNGEP